MNKILIIDFHNFLHRANISFNAFATPDVNDTYSTVFNFVRSFKAIVEQFKPNKIVMAHESHPQFRYDLYPEYKGNRIWKTGSIDTSIPKSVKQTTFDKFEFSKNIVKPLLKYFPVSTAKADGYEADDVAGTLVKHRSGDEEIIVVSGDGDYTQLLQMNYANVSIYQPIKKAFVEAPKYHFLVHKILAGDKSDNIKGLVKPKLAMQLTNDPKLLEKWLELPENQANFNIRKKLVEFADIPLDQLKIDDYQYDPEMLKSAFKAMELPSLLVAKYWDKFNEIFENVK